MALGMLNRRAMTRSWKFWRWPLEAREKRLIFYFFVVASVAAWKFIPRPWNPSSTTETQHYLILSTATKVQVDDIAPTVEQLYVAYSINSVCCRNSLANIRSSRSSFTRIEPNSAV
jgi:hypothetical protein